MGKAEVYWTLSHDVMIQYYSYFRLDKWVLQLSQYLGVSNNPPGLVHFPG